MGASTFTGPIKAGNIIDTSGTTLGQDVKNVGYVLMAQTSAFTQATNVGVDGVYKTDIVIPGKSRISSITVIITSPLTGLSSDATLGTSSGGSELTFAMTFANNGTYGMLDQTGGFGKVGKWVDVDVDDVRVWVNSANTGTGAGVVIVNYLQAVNLV